MAHNAKLYIPMRLPLDLHLQAEQLAISANFNNLPGPTASGEPLQLALDVRKMWPNGQRLRIRFLDGHPLVQGRVINWAQQWTEYANLIFDFGNHNEADIRISFADVGSWSCVGIDASFVEQHKPTMNFGWLTPSSSDKDYAEVVLHEFGHAIGCIHEHQTPIAKISWNRKAVYDYCAKLGWSKHDTDSNFFEILDRNSTNFSHFDPNSIMLYPILADFTLNGFEIPANSRLSDTDKQFIAKMYPKL